MKQDKLAEALNEIRDEHLQEALHPKKNLRPLLLGGIAALLALVLGFGFLRPAAPSGLSGDAADHFLVASPEYPTIPTYPGEPSDFDNYTVWLQALQELHNQPEGYADSLENYFNHFVPQVLALAEGENAVCSPVNVYMALAMLAETTGGNSRTQILDLLGAESIEALRTQAKHVWTAHYNNDGLSTSILGSSLWLRDDCAYNEETTATLAREYYASVFRGDLGSEEINLALQAWLNEHTGGLLQEQAGQIELSRQSNLALATTIYYQVQWLDRFHEGNNTQAIFHGSAGNTQQVFMHRELTYGPYFWGDSFGAVYLDLEDHSRMWLFLPDEGYTPEAISAEAMAFLAQSPTAYDEEYPNQKSLRVNLSLPKFDIASNMDLISALKALGITDVFSPGQADFSSILTADDGGWVDKVAHAARVAIDEEGVTAAAFTVIDRCGAAMPPEDEMDFTLDRPFLFIIESRDGLPLFTGTVHNP